MGKTFLVVGLGNPGEEYEKSRHNVGFMVIDELASGSDFEEDKYLKAAVAKVDVGKNSVVLIKPLTFMNKSGQAAAVAKKGSKIGPEDVIIVHDDVDLPLGSMKISFGRGAGGHRGVLSVLKALKTKNVIRVRVGVVPTTPAGKLKKPKGEQKVLDHLMGDFKKSDGKKLNAAIKNAADSIKVVIEEGKDRAMNQFN